MPSGFAEVLTAGHARKQEMFAPTTSPTKPVHFVGKQNQDNSPSDPLEMVDTAAHALLGLQNESVGALKLSHKQVEQYRRLQAKKHFDELRALVPGGMEQKNDRNKILAISIQYLRCLQSGKAMSSDGDVEGRGSSPSCDMMFEMEEDGKKDQMEKRLSHNEVEQRRRLQAKKHYDELRSLLPNSSKYDKNTLLQHTILAIREKTGFTDDMMAHRGHPEDSESMDSRPASVASSVGSLNSSWQEAMLSGSFTSLSSLAASPSDVAGVAADFSRSLNSASKRGRKRTPSKQMADADIYIPNQFSRSAPSHTSSLQALCEMIEGSASFEQKKRSRRIADAASLLAGISLSSSPSPTEGQSAMERDEEDDDADDVSLDALSLLSHCAVALSEPNTPALLPTMPDMRNSDSVITLSLAA